MKTYIVVENAGYVGETDVATFTRLHDAFAYMRTQYEQDEIESLHVDICTEINGDREYVY